MDFYKEYYVFDEVNAIDESGSYNLEEEKAKVIHDNIKDIIKDDCIEIVKLNRQIIDLAKRSDNISKIVRNKVRKYINDSCFVEGEVSFPEVIGIEKEEDLKIVAMHYVEDIANDY